MIVKKGDYVLLKTLNQILMEYGAESDYEKYPRIPKRCNEHMVNKFGTVQEVREIYFETSGNKWVGERFIKLNGEVGNFTYHIGLVERVVEDGKL